MNPVDYKNKPIAMDHRTQFQTEYLSALQGERPMTTLTCTQTGQNISLVQQLATSGEGVIWRTDRPGFLAKIYSLPKPERIQKLEVMIAHPPQDPNAHINHISFAWPTSLLQDASGVPVGFLMPEVSNALELLEVYNPFRRQKVLPEFNWLYLHATAMNVASLVWAIHLAGYVLGDLKPQNILVTNGALPSIIDTDSFQVRHPKTGELYRCPVGSEGFTPAELLGQDLATVEQTVIHDRFRLGVIIHLLLFGDHPFKGRWVGPGDSPDPNELLQKGWWPYAPNSPIQASPLTTPLAVVHPAIQDCFVRCFNTGHLQPSARPSANEWMGVLREAIADLKRCHKVKNHYFSKTYGRCYWCDRKKLLGVDVFPAIPTTQQTLVTKTTQRVKVKVDGLGQKATQKLKRSPSHATNVTAPTQLPSSPLPTPKVRTAIPTTQISSAPSISTSSPWIKRPWVRLGGIAGILVGLFSILVWLSQSQLEGEEMGLTLVGGGLCFGLIVFCLILVNLTQKSQN
jgi:DNA-binding helix-hairpin-helix protein with protein kinase domain